MKATRKMREHAPTKVSFRDMEKNVLYVNGVGRLCVRSYDTSSGLVVTFWTDDNNRVGDYKVYASTTNPVDKDHVGYTKAPSGTTITLVQE